MSYKGLTLLEWIEWAKDNESLELVRIRKYTDCCTKSELMAYYDKERKTSQELLKPVDNSRFYQTLKCRNCKHIKDIKELSNCYYIVCHGAAATCNYGDSAPMSCEGFEEV